VSPPPAPEEHHGFFGWLSNAPDGARDAVSSGAHAGAETATSGYHCAADAGAIALHSVEGGLEADGRAAVGGYPVAVIREVLIKLSARGQAAKETRTATRVCMTRPSVELVKLIDDVVAHLDADTGEEPYTPPMTSSFAVIASLWERFKSLIDALDDAVANPIRRGRGRNIEAQRRPDQPRNLSAVVLARARW
jgi:hypothetical protein